MSVQLGRQAGRSTCPITPVSSPPGSVSVTGSPDLARQLRHHVLRQHQPRPVAPGQDPRRDSPAESSTWPAEVSALDLPMVTTATPCGLRKRSCTGCSLRASHANTAADYDDRHDNLQGATMTCVMTICLPS